MHALRGKEFIEYDNPFDVGMTGLLGFASGYKAIKEADALLMLGTDFPYQQFYPDNANVVQVDIRGRNLGRRTPIELGLVGTVKDTLAALQPLLRQKGQRDHLDRSLRHYAQDPQDAGRAGGQRPRSHARSGPNTLRDLLIGWPPTTRCSLSTSARRSSGRRAT